MIIIHRHSFFLYSKFKCLQNLSKFKKCTNNKYLINNYKQYILYWHSDTKKIAFSKNVFYQCQFKDDKIKIEDKTLHQGFHNTSSTS